MPSADPTAHTGTADPATADVDAGTGSEAHFRAGSHAGPSAGVDADLGADAGAGGLGEDTMDLRLPDELFALIADESSDDHGARRADQGTAQPSVSIATTRAASGPSFPSLVPAEDDLLDRVADWGPADTPVGVFQLVPVRVERDLPLISRWMNDPAAAAFWGLSGPQNVTEGHVLTQLAGDGRCVPCIGVLDGTPMSYWEIYRADLDPLARHYPARPHDTGLHLLVGAVADRGHGLGGLLLRAVADLVLVRRPSCARVIAEPDIRNTPSIAAFLTAGFRFSAEVDLPDKRAALMVRDRAIRHLL
ncbi:GNAT family N-acetyltransferase [Streptomyces sp. DH10]|uniref:GNAT family N-acetyltransferase n=1 Tax=Streptomyces sp. DH10 TaxID=3040121 RepID=UPI0024410A5D|nr:GNAT family N-acetyltransferase [Streptomyces sp. DH10]MDG9713957.1 GNAT family N-acetyltransferase [Streptomyces sp. DH10]